ncbi:MAG: S8/S53 family peptidase [Bacilli bacterium]
MRRHKLVTGLLVFCTFFFCLTKNRNSIPYNAYYLQEINLSKGNEKAVYFPKIAVLDSGIQNSVYHNQNIVFNNTVERKQHSSHGLSTFSIIGCSEYNNLGLACCSDIYIFDVEGKDNIASIQEVESALYCCCEYGIDIVNISLGIKNDSGLIRAAIDRCISKGIIVVASSGNSGTDSLLYPAAYGNVIAVSGIDKECNVWKKANFNSSCFLLPCLDIICLDECENGIVINEKSGTSFSAPIMTSIISLYERKYGKVTEGEMKDRLTQSYEENIFNCEKFLN